MRIINQKVEVLPELIGSTVEELTDNVYKMIEIAARTCYKSEKNITKDSAMRMYKSLVSNEHFGMLRHGTIYLKVENRRGTYYSYTSRTDVIADFYSHNKYSTVCYNYTNKADTLYITTNCLVLLENDRLEDLQYICNSTDKHCHKTTFRFTSSLVINREIQTHDGKMGRGRAEESTRFCNYASERLGSELTFVYPHWATEDDRKEYEDLIITDNYISAANYDKKEMILGNISNKVFASHLVDSMNDEARYLRRIEMGLKPEDARDKLPLDIKSELVYTLFDDDWKHVFKVRCHKAAHPQMQLIMNEAKKLFNK